MVAQGLLAPLAITPTLAPSPMPRLAYVLAAAAAVLPLAFAAQLPSDEPVLPSTPFDYDGIELPAHLQAAAVQNTDNTPDDNVLTDAGATLGRVLFYDSRLSQNGSVSCASCHVQANGFSDPSRFSAGFEGGLTGRNSMGLAFSRYYASGHAFWDERAGSFEEQALMPIQDPVEMGMTLDEVVARIDGTPFYGPLFADAFGTDEVTPERIGKALAQFARSIVPFDTRYDEGRALQPPGPPGQTPLSTLTESENRGMAIFFGPARCSMCHAGDLFVLPEPANNGLDSTITDEGAGDGRFKSPSLRNIGLTAPYMHDGRFATLEEVLDHYDSGIKESPSLDPRLDGRGLNLTEQEKADVIAFLHTLTDESLATDVRWSDPFAIENAAEPTAPSLAARFDAPFPNPARGAVTLRYALAQPGHATLAVYDVTGRRVALLADGWQRADEQTARWDASGLAAGVYVARLTTPGGTQTHRVTVVR